MSHSVQEFSCDPCSQRRVADKSAPYPPFLGIVHQAFDWADCQHMRVGVHLSDTHAPVASVTYVRVVLAGHRFGRDLTDGFETILNSSSIGRRRLALTAIPGCPQGSRFWREKLVRVLASMGFHTFLPDEPCRLKDSTLDPIFPCNRKREETESGP